MDRRSKHLSSEDRGVILAEHNRGSSQRAIGALLGRPASTICRELGSVCIKVRHPPQDLATVDVSRCVRFCEPARVCGRVRPSEDEPYEQENLYPDLQR